MIKKSNEGGMRHMEKFREIQMAIEDAIKNHRLKTGDKLPSVRKTAKLYGSSAATALKAYEGLVAQHIIYNSPRKGYYVVRVPSVMIKDSFTDFESLEPLDESLPISAYKQCINIAMQTYENEVFQYALAEGMSVLREAIRKQLIENQVFVNIDDIAITSGSQQTIDILFKMTYPNAKKKILLEHPTYEGALYAAQNNRQEVVFINRTHEGLDLQEVENYFKTQDIKCFYLVPRYHNPTGHSLDVHTRKKLYELACHYHVYLIEDDYMVDMDNSNKLPPIKHFDTEGRVIYLKSYSKTFVPGMRIGSVVLPKRIKSAFIVYKQWSDLTTNTLSQGALTVLLNNGMHLDYLLRIKKTLAKKHHALRQAFEAHGDDRMILTLFEGGSFGSVYVKEVIDWEGIRKALSDEMIKVSSPAYGVHPYSEPFSGIRVGLVRVSEEQILMEFPKVLALITRSLDQLQRVF
jgi:DNA-binding transcriptional MocR family regulator